jgi:nucleoside-diphosphate-sugar epimerase
VVGDLLDIHLLMEHLETCDACIHAAGKLSVNRRENRQLDLSNRKATENVVDAALEVKLKRLVCISSVASLGREEHKYISEASEYEDHPANTPYSDSKHRADLEIFRGLAEGLSVNLLRPSLVLGSGHWQNGSDGVIKKAHAGVPVYPKGGTGLVDVRDVAELAVRMVMHSDDGIDIIANGHNVTFKDLQSQLASRFGKSSPRVPMTGWMIPLINIFDKTRSLLQGESSVISRQSLKRSQRFYYYNNELSQEIFDFTYREVDETFDDCCEAYLHFLKTGEKRVLATN